MAADLNLEWICSLPRSWTYGITRGGRVFFINEEAKSTTWLHPVTGEAVVTGHRRQSADLPTGWEEAYTFEGARYYIKRSKSDVKLGDSWMNNDRAESKNKETLIISQMSFGAL
ncbi:pleckstrin homology domain-containing family A member 5 isoform X26 [Canis lupus baileyi]|uniref:pleckstrin homology domain-containing family A member 5 isoform X13 n=1 Tax=Canis lupus familiaris TaxID=9615 RepID=UPI0003AE235A|nr:pleckstrin homology domain-containing family A member 5 isoform X13 [Canis lupus familiaris]XP_025311053.1 pleckstrin homology domain-containing family A member 5 isoform X24 [Canis lupus dingo]XP_038294786.1 pleckstrin homology domain-containing family A member 5 isoform X13 [Canis lupus familiaris]XP_038432886.1 pleckstrin homology domain-containing family A member 5 isoform X13 [Canis lupus familiaris]|eukprot:XP_005637149.1 pleckstrin homology domain-containing family A member 5 isoform X19 [Canis lupus familiaris]